MPEPELPESTFRSAALVPPTRFAVEVSIQTPWLLGLAAVPEASVPMKQPAT